MAKTERPEIKRTSISKAAAWVNPVSGDEAKDITVRQACLEDIPKIVELLTIMRDDQAARRPDIVDACADILCTEDEIEASLGDDAKALYVALNENDEVVGHLFCEYEKSGDEESETQKLIIANICVKEENRRRTIGTKLYEYAIEAAREAGCTTVELSCWSFDSEGMKFFDAMGFKPLLVTLEKKI